MATELPSAYISHRSPGRIRLRVPTMRNQDDYFERLRSQLASVPGMRRLTTNTRTASVLIEYTGELEALAQIGQRLQVFALGARPHPHSVTEFLHVATSAPDQFVKRVTDGRLDFAGIAAIVLAGAGISQIVRGQALPAGWTLLWNATNLVRDVGKVAHDTGE